MNSYISGSIVPVIPDSVEENLLPIKSEAIDHILSGNGICFFGKSFLYAYVRDDSDNECVMDLYFVLNSRISPAKQRITIKRGYRLGERKEILFRKLCNSGMLLWDKTNKNKFLEELMWRYVYLPPNAENMKDSVLLDYLYSSFSGIGIKKTLYDAKLYALASNIDSFLDIDRNGATPEEILRLPISLLTLYNRYPLDFEDWIYPGQRKKAIEVYEKYSSYIDDTVPNIYQWRYLVALVQNKKAFNEEIYNVLEGGDSYMYDHLKLFCDLRDKVEGTIKIEHIPPKEELHHVIDVLEAAEKYQGSEEYISRRFSEINDPDYLFSDDDFYIDMPYSLEKYLEFELELKNNVLGYLYWILEGVSTVLFISWKDSDKPCAYIVIEGNSISDLVMKDYKKPDAGIESFVTKYAESKGFEYKNSD